MKRKRFTALKVTLTAMMLTAALTSGAGSAYAADLSQEGGSEPTVTITPSPEVTPELPLPTSTPKPTPVPKNGLMKEGKVYRYYVNNKPVRNKWATNETVGGIKFNKNGYASNLTQARCKLAARNFIARHSNANASNYEKFRSCFYYIMAYTNFVGYMDPTPQEFKTKDWVYKYSLQMFQNGLTAVWLQSRRNWDMNPMLLQFRMDTALL